MIYFRKTKVGQLDVACAADKHIVGLDVAMNDAVLVQVVESERYLT